MFFFTQLLILCGGWSVLGCNSGDETSFVQTAATMRSRKHTKPGEQSVTPQSLEDLSEQEILIRWRAEKISGLRIGSIIGFKTTYEWSGPLTSYNANHGKSFVIKGFGPMSIGTFPVYLHLTGNYCDYNADVNLDFVRLMAEKGYVAASVEYDNGRFCPDFCETGSTCKYHDVDKNGDHIVTDNTHVFNDTSSLVYFGNVTVMTKARALKQALDVLCSSAMADCSKGVAISGFSQGAFISSVWSHIDSRISALLLMGMGLLQDWELIDHYPWHKLHRFESDCILDEGMSKYVPRAKRRYLDGMYDKFVGWYHSALQRFSGVHCQNTSAPINCIQPDGSGYYIISPMEYTEEDDKEEHKYPLRYADGVPLQRMLASHNFYSDNRPIANPGNLLPSFKYGSMPWCFHPSFDWLASAARGDGWVEVPSTGVVSGNDGSLVPNNDE
jgi:hypothetical protein